MTRWGYTMLSEQQGPADLVAGAVGAERAGFDFTVTSDHFSPWLRSQSHSPYAWAVLGAAAHATERVELTSFVTCPTMRYHPAVVAQKAATLQLLSGGRFRLGLGAGENLNEHVVGRGWPIVQERHAMLVEAVEIIRSLLAGEVVERRGEYFAVQSARLWDLPDAGPPIGIAASGPRSVAIAGRLADMLIAVEPSRAILSEFARTGGAGKPAIGQLPVCYDPDRNAATKRAHDQFRWFGGGWKVNSDLPGPQAFAAATEYVRPDDVASALPCGDDVDEYLEKLAPFVRAGFTEVALVQIGQDHVPFFEWAKRRLLPALRGL